MKTILEWIESNQFEIGPVLKFFYHNVDKQEIEKLNQFVSTHGAGFFTDFEVVYKKIIRQKLGNSSLLIDTILSFKETRNSFLEFFRTGVTGGSDMQIVGNKSTFSTNDFWEMLKKAYPSAYKEAKLIYENAKLYYPEDWYFDFHKSFRTIANDKMCSVIWNYLYYFGEPEQIEKEFGNLKK